MKAKLSGIFLLILITVAFCPYLPAQTADIFNQLESVSPGQGNVKVKQDPAIRNLVSQHLAQQKRINGIRGYRISIYMGSGQEARKETDLVRARFINQYEDVRSYPKWEYPYWKVYVGDFRTKSEALSFLKKIESEYPDAFIREDIISFPD